MAEQVNAADADFGGLALKTTARMSDLAVSGRISSEPRLLSAAMQLFGLGQGAVDIEDQGLWPPAQARAASAAARIARMFSP